MIERVAVIGAGTMGNGIAHVFAQNGFTVNLVDVNTTQLGKAMATIAKNMERQVAKGTITEEQQGQALNNIKTFSNIEVGVSQAQLVVEAATENTDLKLNIFRQLDENAPQDCIL